MKHLILGGARSGKSRFAETVGLATNKKLIYIATSQALDDEMQARIQHHQTSRNARWETIEEPIELAATLQKYATTDTCILVDCLTLWLTNLLLTDETIFLREREALLNALPQLTGDILLVSNEVGMGIVPLDALSRRFVDEAGRLHQQLAQHCDVVSLVVAGLPLTLKS
ncbi:MAG: bifunctional adenosylcobinamide kinase/adenosylcobinamide-phosphate guanylyltransferase [Pseudomonadales bacterium]|jgi:adenosylcobinamide kinase/adenosylcobinamide-phosphate guanylyltransferase|nr:bifunctional adenosylcobinamide kinase/adenosylcobinamide-phosphate guanylyltransferase [Pseudomonadales bacterium]